MKIHVILKYVIEIFPKFMYGNSQSPFIKHDETKIKKTINNTLYIIKCEQCKLLQFALFTGSLFSQSVNMHKRDSKCFSVTSHLKKPFLYKVRTLFILYIYIFFIRSAEIKKKHRPESVKMLFLCDYSAICHTSV